MEEYGNASTSYEMGRRTREALEGAREQIAMLIRAKPEEIFFTSGGSESDNWVIKNVAAEKKEKGKHVITSKIEHHAVLRVTANIWRNWDMKCTIWMSITTELLIGNSCGGICGRYHIGIHVMTGNNEIGTVEPDVVVSNAAGTGALFHTDGAHPHI